MQFHKTPCILLSIAGVFLVIACKKDNHDTTTHPKVPLIKTVFAMAGNDSDLRTYSYDAQGRVTKIVYRLYGTGYYTYTDTGVVNTFYNLNDSLTGTTVYKLDAHGRAISYTESAEQSDVFTSTFNSNGQILSHSDVRTLPAQPVRTWVTSYYYTGKNLDSSIEVYNYNGTNNSSAAYYDADVEDAMQTAYINAYLHLDKFKSNSSFGTWLTRIMINQCLGQMRKTRSITTNISSHDNSINMVTPDSELHNKELSALLENAIENLPEKYRLVFVLREVEDLSVKETAEALDIAPSNVKTRLNRAKTMLKDHLKGYMKEHIYAFHLTRCDRIVNMVLTELKIIP